MYIKVIDFTEGKGTVFTSYTKPQYLVGIFVNSGLICSYIKIASEAEEHLKNEKFSIIISNRFQKNTDT